MSEGGNPRLTLRLPAPELAALKRAAGDDVPGWVRRHLARDAEEGPPAPGAVPRDGGYALGFRVGRVVERLSWYLATGTPCPVAPVRRWADDPANRADWQLVQAHFLGGPYAELFSAWWADVDDVDE